MRQPFFEDLMTAMYPSGLLHTFGVNGKISGSVGAVGEMQEVLPLLHSPRGCGFHYRYSARRRHQPFYSVLTSNLGSGTSSAAGRRSSARPYGTPGAATAPGSSW